MGEIAVGGVVTFFAGILAGIAGFGASLMSTPLLLLLGFPLPFVVTANLTITMLTRVPIVYHLRRFITLRRAAALVLGSIPGFYVGTLVLTSVDAGVIKLGTGLLVMLLAVLLFRSVGAPPSQSIPGAPAVAGVVGGFLGATTSLNGMPPVLLLARDKAKPLNFLADLAVYFVVANAIGLLLLLARDALVGRALFPATAVWLPGALLGNFLGIRIGRRLPELAFRRFTIALAFVAGLLTTVTA